MVSRRLIGLVLAALFLAATAWPLIRAADDTIARADELYGKRKDLANARAGVDLLLKVVENQPAHYGALWRLARFHWYLGDRAGEKKDKLALYERGKSYAERATQADGNGVDGHFWLAALIGSIGEERGILQSLFMVAPMKKELEKCLELDPKHADSHDVMAQLLWKVPGFAGGNLKKALEEAKLAVAYGPDAIDHWLHYGRIAAANKDYKLARTALERALSLPDDPGDPAGSQKDKAEARAELKKIEGKK